MEVTLSKRDTQYGSNLRNKSYAAGVYSEAAGLVDMAAVSPFLYSLLDPMAPAPIPDADPTPMVLKTVNYSSTKVNIYDAPTRSTSNDTLFYISWHAADDYPITVMAYGDDQMLGHPRYMFVEYILPDQAISSQYAWARLSTAGVNISSATVSGTRFNVQGTMNVAVVNTAPYLHTISHNDIPSLSRSSIETLNSVSVANGIVSTMPLVGKKKFKAFQTNAVLDCDCPLYVTHNFTTINPVNSGNVNHYIFANLEGTPDGSGTYSGSTRFAVPPNLTKNVFVNITGHMRRTGGATDETFQLIAGYTQWTWSVDHWTPVRFVLTSQVKTTVNSTDGSDINLSLRLYDTPLEFIVFRGVVVGTPDIDMVFNNVVVTIQQPDYGSIGRNGPVTLISMSGVSTDQEIIRSAKFHYEAVPDSILQRDVKTVIKPVEDLMHFYAIETLIANMESMGISTVYTANDFNNLRDSGYFLQVATRNTFLSSAAGFWSKVGGFFKGLGKGIVHAIESPQFMPMVNLLKPVFAAGKNSPAYAGGPLPYEKLVAQLHSRTNISIVELAMIAGTSYKGVGLLIDRLVADSVISRPAEDDGMIDIILPLSPPVSTPKRTVTKPWHSSIYKPVIEESGSKPAEAAGPKDWLAVAKSVTTTPRTPAPKVTRRALKNIPPPINIGDLTYIIENNDLRIQYFPTVGPDETPNLDYLCVAPEYILREYFDLTGFRRYTGEVTVYYLEGTDATVPEGASLYVHSLQNVFVSVIPSDVSVLISRAITGPSFLGALGAACLGFPNGLVISAQLDASRLTSLACLPVEKVLTKSTYKGFPGPWFVACTDAEVAPIPVIVAATVAFVEPIFKSGSAIAISGLGDIILFLRNMIPIVREVTKFVEKEVIRDPTVRMPVTAPYTEYEHRDLDLPAMYAMVDSVKERMTNAMLTQFETLDPDTDNYTIGETNTLISLYNATHKGSQKAPMIESRTVTGPKMMKKGGIPVAPNDFRGSDLLVGELYPYAEYKYSQSKKTPDTPEHSLQVTLMKIKESQGRDSLSTAMTALGQVLSWMSIPKGEAAYIKKHMLNKRDYTTIDRTKAPTYFKALETVPVSSVLAPAVVTVPRIVKKSVPVPTETKSQPAE